MEEMSVLPLTHVTQRTGYLYGVKDNIKSISGLDYTIAYVQQRMTYIYPTSTYLIMVFC